MDSSPFTLVANYRTLEPGSETDIGAWEGIMFFDTLGEGRVRVKERVLRQFLKGEEAEIVNLKS